MSNRLLVAVVSLALVAGCGRMAVQLAPATPRSSPSPTGQVQRRTTLDDYRRHIESVVDGARNDIRDADAAISDDDFGRASTLLKRVADSMDRELAWLRDHPPSDCYADAFATWTDGVRAYAGSIPQLRRALDAPDPGRVDGLQARLGEADRIVRSPTVALARADCTEDEPDTSP